MYRYLRMCEKKRKRESSKKKISTENQKVNGTVGSKIREDWRIKYCSGSCFRDFKTRI